MKKRLLSLLVALCMAVTLLPVSAITAWAEGGGQLKIVNGYPEGSRDSNGTYTISCSGDGWSYDGSTRTLKLHPANPTEYDLKECGNIRQDYNSILCSAIIEKNATIVNGNFWDIDNPGPSITNYGTITSGTYSMPVINHGTITGGIFYSSVSNESEGTIENGTFRSTVTNNGGTINGGTFKDELTGSGIEPGYTLTATMPDGFDHVSVNGYRSCYVIPNQASVSVDISYRFDDTMYGYPNLPPLDVTIDNAPPTLLSDWCGSNFKIESDGFSAYEVTFTAPSANGSTVTISPLTRLVIDKDGYPAKAQDWNGNRANYTGEGWKFDASNKTLTLTSGSYDFSGEENALRPLNPDVQLVVEPGAKLTGGAFAKEPKGAGTFKTVTLNGTGSITAVNGLASGDWGNTLYAVQTGNNTITASEPIRDINRILLENDDSLYPNSSNKKTVCINIESLGYMSALDPEADIILNQASHGLPLIMASDGTPVIVDAPFEVDGNYYNYYGDGWKVNKVYDGMSHGTLYLTGGKTYNFRFTDPVHKTGQLDAVKCGILNEGSIIEDGVFHNAVANGLPNSTSSTTPRIKGGTFAAGLYYNNGEITGGAFNGKDDSFLTHETVLSGNYRSVTVNGGAIVKVNDTRPLVPGETGYDLVQGSAWDLYSYAGTVLTVEADADITNINGQEIGKAFTSYYLNGETNKKVVCFEMPDSDVELNSTKIVVPDPKPEPKPEPEASTYTLTVKGGTFTYNGGEAMTSASVPVDAEVKVTLNQSAVPEGMVFDLWAMDEASLLGNPAVAYNQESFTIPAGSVAKGSIVTVEAQYRDATIESEPSILGTAAIIGVAGAGTAVIVWQGYRIGMELYEKYFQPTPEEDAVVEPTLESQMTDPIS